MDTDKKLMYLRAKKKVDALKGFYSHLTVYLIVNSGLILVLANVFGQGETDFSSWEIYITAFFWGIGLVCHGIFVLFELYFHNSLLRKWEEKKIKEFLEKDG